MRTRLLIQAAAATAILTGTACGNADPVAQHAATPSPTSRPLALTGLEPGTSCPTTPISVTSNGGELRTPHVVLRGDLLGGGSRWPGQSYVNTTIARPGYEEWGGNKTVVSRVEGVPGPIVIRGNRLDGPGSVRFERGGDTFSLDSTEPSDVDSMLVPASGCYELTVAGDGWNDTVTFETQLCRAASSAPTSLPPCK